MKRQTTKQDNHVSNFANFCKKVQVLVIGSPLLKPAIEFHSQRVIVNDLQRFEVNEILWRRL